MNCSFTAKARAFVLMPAVLMLSGAAMADYRYEAGVNGLHSSEDARTLDLYNLDFTFYQSVVSDEDVPLTEAAFLSRASSIRVEYEDNDIEPDGSDSVDGSGWELGTRQVIADIVFIDARYGETEELDVDIEKLGLGVGLYINETTTLALGRDRVDSDAADDEYDTFSFNLKSVVETYAGNNVAGEYTLSVGESAAANTVIGLKGAVDYYFNHRISLGGGFEMVLPNNGDDQAIYSIDSKFFITPNVAIGAGFSLTVFRQKDDEDPNVDNTEAFSLSIVGRI